MKKQILTGAESFEKIIEGDYFYIDKTLFIKELLENRGEVTLITRPRRFGKTLNMSMLKSFFDIGTPPGPNASGEGAPTPAKDSKPLFSGLKIMGHNDIVEKHMNKYPVIFLTLKNVEAATYKSSLEKIKIFVSALYRQNIYLYESDRLSQQQKKEFHRYCSRDATEEEMATALYFLTEYLYTYHNKRAIVLMDEYDTPITNALMKGYYDEMIEFMRGFMGSVFKTNDYLEFGVLTGVQRISREGLVSGFNNPLICGIMSKKFATCFGFTDEEVKEACEMYGLGGTFDEVKRWYDGYRFGGVDMYNPWSITGYLNEKKFDEYWVNTGSLTILRDIFYKGDAKLKNDMAGLITGAPVTMSLMDGITYPIVYSNTGAFWTLMLNAGYIKPCNGAEGETFNAELVNMEIRNIFTRYAKEWFKERQSSVFDATAELVESLLRGDAEGVSATLNDELFSSPSYHDLKGENSYHMFIFGMLLALSREYTVYSNPESGKGRSDCMIKPAGKEKYAVVVEFKHVKKESTDLKQEAEKGLRQIEEKAYVHDLKREGYERVHKYGIAFHKKRCEVAMGGM